MKKEIILLIIIITIFSVGVYSLKYSQQFYIEDKVTSIQSGLRDWLNRGSSTGNEPTIIEFTQLDDTNSYVVLFQLQNTDMGYAHLIKGRNGKFKIEQSGHGTNTISYEVINSNDGIYGILLGENPDLTINHIKAELYYEDFEFIVDVSLDEMFIKYIRFPNNIEKTFPANQTYYDKFGSIINPVS